MASKPVNLAKSSVAGRPLVSGAETGARPSGHGTAPGNRPVETLVRTGDPGGAKPLLRKLRIVVENDVLDRCRGTLHAARSPLREGFCI
jgi:hypothetical protein